MILIVPAEEAFGCSPRLGWSLAGSAIHEAARPLQVAEQFGACLLKIGDK